jgi:hypothetical protein
MKLKHTTGTHKYCIKCGDSRPVAEFYKNCRKRDGLSTYCQKHQREVQHESYKLHGEKYKAKQRKKTAVIVGEVRKHRAEQERTRYHLRKQKAEEMIMQILNPEPKQEQMFPPVELPARPDTGPKCSVPGCGKVLMYYEIEWGKCLKHKHGGIIQARESVPLMMTDKPQRTRVQRRYHQQQAAPVAGD